VTVRPGCISTAQGDKYVLERLDALWQGYSQRLCDFSLVTYISNCIGTVFASDRLRINIVEIVSVYNDLVDVVGTAAELQWIINLLHA